MTAGGSGRCSHNDRARRGAADRRGGDARTGGRNSADTFVILVSRAFLEILGDVFGTRYVTAQPFGTVCDGGFAVPAFHHLVVILLLRTTWAMVLALGGHDHAGRAMALKKNVFGCMMLSSNECLNDITW